MKMHRTFRTLFWVFIFWLSVTLIYLRYFQPAFLSYPELPLKVEGPVRPGEVVKLIVVRCNNSDRAQSYEVSRWFKCAGGSRLPVVLPAGRVPPIEPGCAPARSELNVAPIDTKPGWCKVGGFGIVKGTLRTIEVPWESEWFEVIP